MSPVGYPDDIPVDEVDEQLVAYLDGELPPEERRALEQRLGADAELRKRLRELQNGWEMLDELPLASSSSQLLETTLRMAAIEGEVGTKSTSSKRLSRKLSRAIWFALATVGCFALGIALTRGRDYLRFQKQLHDLPVAMHLDAYLRAADLELMDKLMQMPEWRQANEMADQFGKWDVQLASQIDAASPKARQELLPKLPIEDQKTVAAAWERFEKIPPQDRQAAYQIAERIADQPDPQSLLKAMDRFAIWRQTWLPEDRERFAQSSGPQREAFLQTALDRTQKQWTQESARKLSDEEVETIYHALRQIGRLRLKQVAASAEPEVKTMIDSFGSSDQTLDPRYEAFFLHRLFDPSYFNFGRRGSESGVSSAVATFRKLTEDLRAPLRADELDWLQAVLPRNLNELVNAVSGLPMVREELLRTLAEESLTRIQMNRSGETAVERYLRAGDEREEIDLLPAEQLLRRLQGDGFGPR